MSQDCRTHIIHIIYRLDFGGLENGLVNIINGSHQEFRHTIIALNGVNPDFANRIAASDVEIHDVHKKPGKDLAVYFRIWKLLRQLRPDIVHTRNLTSIEAQVPALLAGVPVRIHGEHGWDIADPKGDVRKYQILRRVIGACIHRFIPLSSELKNYLIQKVGIPDRKITMICNGVNLACFAPLPDRHERDESAPFVFLTVGRLEKIKGHRYLIESLGLLKQEMGDIDSRLQLRVVGDGSERQSIEARAQELGLESVVLFLGSRSDIAALLNDCDAFVLPSLAEGISNTILEALACGKPVIATHVGGNTDLVAHGEYGLIVESESPIALASALKTYLSDPSLAKRHGERAYQEAVSRFSLDGMIEQYKNVYHSATSGRRISR